MDNRIPAPAPLMGALDSYYKNLTYANAAKKKYVAIPIELINVDAIPDLSLYLEGSIPDLARNELKLFRPKGSFVSQVEIKNLIQNKVQSIFIELSDAKFFNAYAEGLLASLPSGTTLADPKKIALLQTSALNVMQDVMADPSTENIKRAVKSVSGFVYVLMRDPKAYGMLLQLSNHDHYTLQHSVGVATNALILGRKLGISAEADLIELGTGALLHDIGKTKVNPKIINKGGPLDETEWQEMKQHAKWGYDIIQDNPDVGVRAKLAILQHHEEPAGGGYPLGLKANEIDLYAKIVTISDIYNALTTDRTYSSAKQPFEAFQIIKSKLHHKVEDALFGAMVMIYGGQK